MCSNFLSPLQLNSSAITYAFHPQTGYKSNQISQYKTHCTRNIVLLSMTEEYIKIEYANKQTDQHTSNLQDFEIITIYYNSFVFVCLFFNLDCF